MKYKTKSSKEWQQRYERALDHRRRAIMKVFRASPNIEKGASWFTTFFGGNKYKPDDVAFNRSALKGLVGQGLLIKTQKVYNGKIGNSYRLAPSLYSLYALILVILIHYYLGEDFYNV